MYVQREPCEGCGTCYFIDELNGGFCSDCQVEQKKQTLLDDKKTKEKIMLTGDFYGKMREVLPKVRTDPVTVPCSKCKGLFILEKAHKEVFVVSMFWARQKDGMLTPATPVSNGYYRLCTSCDLKLKGWFNND